jgi:hypothetical protein
MDDKSSMRSKKQPKLPPSSFDHTRSRSASASTAPTRVSVRKGSASGMGIESLHSQSLRGETPVPTPSSAHPPKSIASISSGVQRSKSTMNGGRDSIDDLLDGSSDEDAPVKKKSMNRRRAPTVGGVSDVTADLIDFLNSGPPDLPKNLGPPPPLSATSSQFPSGDKQMKRGRLRSIVSKFKGGSSDKLATQASFDELMSRNKAMNNHPPAFVPPPLSAKRSLHSLSSFGQSQASLARPQPPPLPHSPFTVSGSAPLSPPQSPNTEPASPFRSRASPSTSRKPVPVVAEDTNESALLGQPIYTGPSRLQTPSVDPPSTNSSNVELKNEREVEPKKPIVDSSLNAKNSKDTWAARGPETMLQTPPPSTPALRLSPKAQRHQASPPPPSSSSQSSAHATPAFASQVKDMRRVMANATTADECRLLVDMFFAQAGMPLRDAEFLVPGSADPTVIPSRQHEEAVVDALLGGSGLGTTIAKTSNMVVNSVERPKSQRESGGSGSGAPPTPRSDEYHPAAYRKSPPVAQIVSAEA